MEGESKDIHIANALQKALTECSLEENDLEKQRRQAALIQLDSIVQNWVREESADVSGVKKCTAKVYTFGSYRLGVCSPGSDIDILVVGPRHINRGMFFTSFFNKIKGVGQVSYVKGVPDAYVPVIKCIFDGIAMDLVYAQLNLPTIPEDFDIFDDRSINNIDHKSVLSLNGCRVTDAMLRLVPNVAIFRQVLQVVKLWARRKGIYSNAFGYLGGVSWAILVARVCQLYPNASFATLVEHFFLFYANWRWPSPIFLTPIYFTGNAALDARVCDAVMNRHAAPIITPAYPFVNTAANVSDATLRVLQREFTRAAELIEQLKQKDVSELLQGWRQLLEDSEFFSLYRDFVCVVVCASTKEDEQEWLGWVESRIRLLTTKMSESTSVLFRPLARMFPCGTPEEPFAHAFFVGLDIPYKARYSGTIDLTWAIRDFEFAVCETYHKRREGMTLEVRVIKAAQLPEFVYANHTAGNITPGGNTRWRKVEPARLSKRFVKKGVILREPARPYYAHSRGSGQIEASIGHSPRKVSLPSPPCTPDRRKYEEKTTGETELEELDNFSTLMI